MDAKDQTSSKEKSKQALLKAFRAYLQTVITAEQFGVKERLAALPGSKTVNFCASLAEDPDNRIAKELVAPVWAILQEIDNAAMAFYRPLLQKTIKSAEKEAEYEKVLWQLDFALALILRRFSPMVRFRVGRTKCTDLLVDYICGLLHGAEAAELIRRFQKDFSEEGCDADGTLLEGSFPEIFAWDTYERVSALDKLADEFPEGVKMAARQMHAWPMLAHRHNNNRKRFQELASRLELGEHHPLDATEVPRYRPDTPLVRYLQPIVHRLLYIRHATFDQTYETPEKESEALRQWLWEGKNEIPTQEEIEIARTLRKLPTLTKTNADLWSKSVVVPTILLTDARDWRNCAEPTLQRIAKQKGVKSRATFKSRLLSAVSATLSRLAKTD